MPEQVGKIIRIENKFEGPPTIAVAPRSAAQRS
jgi:hypothetical protein